MMVCTIAIVGSNGKAKLFANNSLHLAGGFGGVDTTGGDDDREALSLLPSVVVSTDDNWTSLLLLL
jgi:hypothetical protein